LSDEERTNITIYERLSGGVVNITSSTYTYDFFLRVVPQSGAGSGVVLDREGHIATNFHVIENAVASAAGYQTASGIEVTLSDQSRHQARVIGIDPTNDLAVLKVDTPEVGWVPIPLGSDDALRVGQKVLAIGNPFGLERTLTTGIISSLGRSIEATNGRVIEGIIQTDAAINPGNSGGPLLNTQGELIGINTAIVSGASGVGFAVPVTTVRRVTNDLISYGRVRRAYLLGEENLMSLAALGQDLVSYLDLGTTSGVMIAGDPRDTPAARAGLRGETRRIRFRNFLIPADGDVIVRIANRQVRATADIATVLESYRPGDPVEVTFVRNRSPLTVTVELGEAPVG
jgi:putative serine protease PepD